MIFQNDLKKTISTSLVFIFLILTLLKTRGQWLPVTCPTTVNLKSVHFANQNIGYAGGSDKILNTIDAGNTWSLVPINGSIINSLHCLNKDTIYFAGNGSFALFNGTVASSTPAPDQKTVFTLAPKFVYYAGQASAYAWQVCGSNYGCTFGVTNLCRQASPGSSCFNDYYNTAWPWFTSIFFTDSLTGYVTSVQTPNYYPPNSSFPGRVLKSSNGGQTWTSISSTMNYNWNSVNFANKLVGYIAGDYGAIKKTTDGGVSWAGQNTWGLSNHLRSIYFSTPDTGCAVGDGGLILGTVDGGQNWLIQTSGTNANLNSVYFTDPMNGYIVGDNGTILKTSTGPVGLKEQSISKAGYIIYPNPIKDFIYINVNAPLKFSVYNTIGEVVLETEFKTAGFQNLDLSGFSTGIYFICLRQGEASYYHKLIKE